jgi:Xaa-Pro aminopeptidase
MDHRDRIARLSDELEASGVDAFLVTNLTNVRYLTGFSGTNGQVLVTATGALFMSDPRYAARAGELVRGADVEIYPAALTDVLGEKLAERGIRRLGLEASTVTLAQLEELRGALDVELVPISGAVEDLRRSKERAEVELVRRAVKLAEEAFEWVLDRLVPGEVTERQIALDLEMHMRSAGADGVSFEPIVGFGPLSAHIHHTPGDRTLGKDELVLLDFGCRVDGYCSDMTRTVAIGGVASELRSLYETVLAAQAAGIDAVRAGASGRDVDAAARAVIEEAGHGRAFGHGLGHGVGLDIHEAPRLHYTSEDTLVAGDVVTIEPGIYIVGNGGIRIEDCVLVTDTGCENLTGAPKHELLEL